MARIYWLGPACALLFLCPVEIHGQAAPREIFFICGSQPNEPTVYVSGVMQGPATAFQGFRNGFATFLSQRYGYKGAVGCLPANTAANAQNSLNARSAALRNQKKNVVETGWTESAALAVAPAVPAAPAAVPVAPATRQAKTAAGSGSGASGGSAGSTGSGSSELGSVLAAVFGTGGGTGAGGASAGGATHGANNTGTSGNAADQSGAAAQVANTLAAVFSSKSASNSATDGQTAPASERSAGLGTAQGQNTKLVVYGCGRQDTQVACVTELTNQDQKDSLVQTGSIWKDTFIVDDRGDRHQRSAGFFLNIDGEQRSQLDISYGKAARFVLMFDGVPAKVQKVALRSTAEGLDVEDISLVAASSDAQKR